MFAQHELNNFAYIDGTNLHKGIAELGWKLDYKRFRIFLRDKYHVGKASVLLRKAVPNNIVFIERFKERLEYKPKRNIQK